MADHFMVSGEGLAAVAEPGRILVSGTQPLVFRAYSIENEGLGNSFTFFVTFPGMLAVTTEHNE